MKIVNKDIYLFFLKKKKERENNQYQSVQNALRQTFNK